MVDITKHNMVRKAIFGRVSTQFAGGTTEHWFDEEQGCAAIGWIPGTFILKNRVTSVCFCSILNLT